MAEQKENPAEQRVPFENEAIPIHGPLSESETERQERDKRDQEYREHDRSYKDRQLAIEARQLVTNRRLAIYTAFLVILGLFGNVISWRMAEVAKESANAAKSAAETADKTLRETEISGTATKTQIDRLITQQQRTADSMADSLGRSKAALDVSIKSSTYQLRPYMSARTMDVIGQISEGTKFSGKTSMINSGHTPAVEIEACGDIWISPFGEPITDEWPCPSPGNPKQDRELSFAVVGSGGTLDISSPGTTASVNPVNLNTLLSANRIRVYFYGYINYRDLLIKGAIHHTTFCGLYNIDLRAWVLCEKHNKAD